MKLVRDRRRVAITLFVLGILGIVGTLFWGVVHQPVVERSRRSVIVWVLDDESELRGVIYQEVRNVIQLLVNETGRIDVELSWSLQGSPFLSGGESSIGIVKYKTAKGTGRALTAAEQEKLVFATLKDAPVGAPIRSLAKKGRLFHSSRSIPRAFLNAAIVDLPAALLLLIPGVAIWFALRQRRWIENAAERILIRDRCPYCCYEVEADWGNCPECGACVTTGEGFVEWLHERSRPDAGSDEAE